MADLIDRQAAIDALCCECSGNCIPCDSFPCGEVEAIQKLSTAAAVEIVRCKDCQYWQDNNNGYPHEECRWGHDETPDADDYCSYGVRKHDRHE